MIQIRLLILGTGGMADIHARAFAADPRVTLVAAVDVLPGRAENFAKAHAMAHHFTSLDEALTWGEFDAAANVTPDNIHHPTTLALLAAGKHVLCEKPLAESFALADEMARAAEASGLVNMVNLTYRNVAALHTARKLVDDGALGAVRHVEASYRQSWLVGNHWGDWKTDPKWLWRLSREHGSRGVLGDVGIHILDFAAFGTAMMPVSLQARLKTFNKAPGDRIGDYPLDVNDSAVMSVEFGNGALGVIHTSRYMTGYDNVLKLQIFGDKGSVEVTHTPGWTEARACLGEDVHAQAWRALISAPVESTYTRFINAIVTGEPCEPDFRRGADLQKILDLCFSPAAETAAPV